MTIPDLELVRSRVTAGTTLACPGCLEPARRSPTAPTALTDTGQRIAISNPHTLTHIRHCDTCRLEWDDDGTNGRQM